MTKGTVKWLSAFVVLVMVVMAVPQTASAETLPTVVITQDTVLTADLNAHVVIGADGITLDGAGHYITGDYTGVGINLTGRSGVTVKNCCIALFNYGILLNRSHDNTLADNTLTMTGDWIVPEKSAIFLDSSYRNTLTGNIVNGRFMTGFDILSSDRNVLIGNMVIGNFATHIYSSTGFRLTGSDHNTLTGNTASVCGWRGFYVFGSHNSITGNTAQASDWGFLIGGHGTVASDNTASDNGQGFNVGGGALVKGNLAIGNSKGFYVQGNATLSENIARDNRQGFCLGFYCWGSNLVNNTATCNGIGFYVERMAYCKLKENWACGNTGYDLAQFQPPPAGWYSGNNRFVKNVFGTVIGISYPPDS